MRQNGWVALVFKDEVISNRPYLCKSQREKIIKEWERLYSKKFFSCAIQIFPNTDDEAIKKDGTNIKYPQGIKRKSFDPYLKIRA